MTTTKTSGKQYQVLILAEPKSDEVDTRIQYYQSPRFLCENNACSLEDPEFECWKKQNFVSKSGPQK